MLDPKDHVVAVGPKKGECYLCGTNLEKAASIQLQKQIPIIKKMTALGRACVDCTGKLMELIGARVEQAKKGEYQA